MRKPKGYWEVYENCYNEALNYKSIKEFEKESPVACFYARKNKWIDSFTWLERKCKQNGYWDYERCYTEAQKYKTRKDFRNCSFTAYSTSLKKGWFSNYYWIEPSKTAKKLTFEYCYNEAKKYTSRTELKLNNPSVYKTSLNNGWLDKYDWFLIKSNPYDTRKDNVYAYFFTELNAVYVGRTVDTKQRNQGHNKKGTVFNFAKANNVDVPLMTILESNLSLEEGREKEDFYVQKYKNEGWNVINKGKTGKYSGSIGSLPSENGRLSKKRCFSIAKTCRTRSELEKKHGSVYNKMLKFNWLNECDWFEEIKKPNGYWNNHENCYNAAKKCENLKEFCKKYGSAYNAAKRNGWLDEFFPKAA